MQCFILFFFLEIIRTDDYNVKMLEGVKADDFYTLRDSDFADVKCRSKNGDTLVNFSYILS